MILEKTLDLIEKGTLKTLLVKQEATRIVIGIGYTGVEVLIKGKSFLGVSYTSPDALNQKECSKINFPGKLTEIPLKELLKWSIKTPSLKKIIGIATLNAVSQYLLKKDNKYRYLKKDLFEYLKIDKNSDITFIGLIKPMIRQFNTISKHITIIEKDLELTPFFTQFNTVKDIGDIERDGLHTDILICTGTTLINGSLERILDVYKDNAGFIALIGPTASILPDILFEYAIDLVGGMYFIDSGAALRILKEGGGTRFFKKYGVKYNLIPSP